MPIAYQLRNIFFSSSYWLHRIDPPVDSIVAPDVSLNRRLVAIVCLVNDEIRSAEMCTAHPETISAVRLGLLLPACGEKVGMTGRFRESELVETPLTGPSFLFSFGECCPLPASGAREAVRSIPQSHLRKKTQNPPHPAAAASS